jgi:DNA anti-recombination protein RmuC
MLETKNELIETLRGSVKDKKEENAELRKMLSESLQRNDKLTQQITFLSNVLAAPKTENEPEYSWRRPEQR